MQRSQNKGERSSCWVTNYHLPSDILSQWMHPPRRLFVPALVTLKLHTLGKCLAYLGHILAISRAYLGHTSGISRAYLKHILDISCIGIPSRMSGSTILGILTWNLLCLLASSKGYQYKEYSAWQGFVWIESTRRINSNVEEPLLAVETRIVIITIQKNF